MAGTGAGYVWPFDVYDLYIERFNASPESDFSCEAAVQPCHMQPKRVESPTADRFRGSTMFESRVGIGVT